MVELYEWLWMVMNGYRWLITVNNGCHYGILTSVSWDMGPLQLWTARWNISTGFRSWKKEPRELSRINRKIGQKAETIRPSPGRSPRILTIIYAVVAVTLLYFAQMNRIFPQETPWPRLLHPYRHCWKKTITTTMNSLFTCYGLFTCFREIDNLAFQPIQKISIVNLLTKHALLSQWSLPQSCWKNHMLNAAQYP